MVLRINERSITDNFLPSVYIERITLESSSVSTPLHNLDPHIKNEYKGEGLPEYLKDNVQRTQDATKSAREKTLKVSLDLSIKQKITNSTNLALSWLSSLDLQDFMKIIVVQTTDPVVSALFSAAGSLHLLVELDEAEFIVAYNTMGGNSFRVSRHDAFVRLKNSINKYPPRVLTPRDVIEARNQRLGRDGEDIVDPENKFRDSNGNTYQDIPFFLSYEIEDVNPSHLGYFVFASLDTNKIIDVYELEPDSDDKLLLEGKRTIDYVIDNGRVVSQADVYYDRSGQIWAGPIHFRDPKDNSDVIDSSYGEAASYGVGVPYAGYAGESDNPEVLTRRRVANNKVQDFRVVEKLKGFKVDTSSVKNMLNSSLFTREMRGFARDQSILKEAAFWSSLALSKDESENINYFFSINLKDVLKKHTKYGHLFSDGDLKLALHHMRIVSMRVFRRRVKKIDILNKLGSPVNAEYVFDPNEERPLLGTYGEGGSGNSDSLRQVTGMHPEQPGVCHFSGTDTSMKDVTYGHYRYEVEMDIEDNTIQFFQESFEKMTGMRKKFQEYFEISKQPQNFQAATNRFKTAFRESGYEADVRDVIEEFVTFFNSLRFKEGVDPGAENGINDSYYVTKFDVNTLVTMASPVTGSPHSIGLVLNFMDYLLESYAQILGYGLGSDSMFSSGANADQLPSGGLKGAFSKGASINLYHHFREVWDSDIPKNYGYNYLEVEASDLPGINIMSGVSLEQRADIEIDTYYTEPGEVRIADDKFDLGLYDPEQTKFTFFSPSAVHIGTEKIELGAADSFNTDINNFAVGAIAEMNFNFGSPNIGGLKIFQNDAVRSMYSAIFEASSGAAMTNATIKNTQDVVYPIPPQERKDEFNGQEMSADCPPDLPEDRDDTADAEKKTGLANSPGINLAASQSGAEGLRKWLSIGSILKGTGMDSNYAANGKNYRAAETKKSAEVEEEEVEKASGVKNFMKGLVNRAIEGSVSPRGRRRKRSGKYSKRGGRKNELTKEETKREERARKKKESSLLRSNSNPNNQRNAGVGKIPLQLMSLAAGVRSTNPLEGITANGKINPIIAGELFAATILNYHSLGELQFFVGYQEASDDIFMNVPIFERLDRTRLIANSGKRLLCRIVRYEDKELGFLEPKGLVMPIYDRYFILDVRDGLESIAAPVEQPDPPLTRQEATAQLERSGAKLRENNQLAATLELRAGQAGLPAWVVSNSGAAYQQGGAFNAAATQGAEEARRERLRELEEEKERQRQCYINQLASQGIRAGRDAQPDTWQWSVGDTDYCADAEAAPLRVLTPVEAESCRLWARMQYARSALCDEENNIINGANRMGRCHDGTHGDAYRAHKRRNGLSEAGNGKCRVKCLTGPRQGTRNCVSHPYRRGRTIPYHAR